MKKKQVSRSGLFLLIAVTGFFSACHTLPEEYASSDKYRLIWNDDPATTVTLAWDQREEGAPVVYYDVRDHGRKFWRYRNKQTVFHVRRKYGMNTHFARLTGLSPGREYFFVIRDMRGVSRRFWFRTAPDRPEPFTFIAGGDTKSQGDPLLAGRASNRLVAHLRPLFVLFIGDFCSGDGTNPLFWREWLNDWFSLATTADGRIFPLIPVQGNHENGDKKNLVYLFDTPFQNSDSTNIFYSLSLGRKFLHIIVLNSEVDPGGYQRRWLEEDLKTHKDYLVKIAAYHRPFRPHCANEPENDYEMEQWAGLFYRYGLHVAFEADAHVCKITYPLRPDTAGYEGFSRDDDHGTLFIGEGGWGAHPRSNDDDKPWTRFSGSYNQFKWIHLFPGESGEGFTMKIHIVITGKYDEKNILTTYDTGVERLTEKNVFCIPDNIFLQRFPDGKYFVSYSVN